MFSTISRRACVVLPLVLAATVFPIVRPEVRPKTEHWAVSLSEDAPVEAPGEFGLVGVSLPDRSRPPTGVQVRASRDGTRWGRWTDVEFDTDVGPDLGSRETGAHTSMPVWTGRNRFVDVRFPQGRPQGTKVHLIDPGPDPSAPLPSAMASPSTPGIVSRAGWGADESIRRGGPSYAEPLKLAVVHHTATADSYPSSESDDIVRGIYAYHVKTNGWDDIGYSFLVDRYGRIFEGRYGGTNRTVVGAHSMGFNRYSTGISIIGNFASSKPPEVAMQSLKRIVSWRMDHSTADPEGSTVYTSGGSNKWPAGKRVALKNVSAHLDVGQTACPGQPLYGALGWLRKAAHNDGRPKLFNATRSRAAITPNADGTADGLRLKGTFSSAVQWRADVLDNVGKVIWTLTGNGSTLDVPWWGKTSSGQVVRHADYTFKVTGRNSGGSLRAYYMPFKVFKWPNGTLFAADGGGRYILEKNKLRPVSSWDSRASRYSSSEYVNVGNWITSFYATGSMIGFREGSLVSLGSNVYVISGGKRRPTTKSVLTSKGYNTSAIVATTSGALRPHALGSTFGSASGYPTGATLRSRSGTEAWMIGTTARHFFNQKVRGSYLIRSIDLAGPADAAVATGIGVARLGFRDGTLIKQVGSNTVYVISDGRRRPVSSTPTFARMGYKSSNVREVTAAEMALHRQGSTL